MVFCDNNRVNNLFSMSAGFIGTFGNLLGSKSALLLKSRIKIMSDSRPSSDLAKFRSVLKESKNVLILSGAGMSAESGIPTFRGEGGYWRTYVAANLDTPQAFKANPSLVWEFYHYRRELARLAQPNPGHIAVAEFERKSLERGRYVTLVTQNFDNLHARAGSLNIVELHGNLYKTRCTKCNNIEVNNDSPICEALRDKGAPDPNAVSSDIPLELLPRCKVLDCGGLLRPHVVWFGEILEEDVLDRAHAALSECDVCLIIGTSSVVYPAAMFAPQAASRGIPVAEFNIEATPVTENFGYYFQGGNVAFIKIEDGKAWIKFQVENTAKEVFEKCTDSKLKVEDNKLEVSLLLEKRNRSSSIKWFLGELMERRQKQNGGKQYFNRNRQCSSF